MVTLTEDQVLYIKEMGFVRLSDGTYAMDLTAESRIPVDLALLVKVDELITEQRKTNELLTDLLG